MNLKLIVLLVIGIWIGMLIGISFLEAPLKFRAPNITLPLGLGIGKLVFSALNKFEIVFSLLLTFWLIKNYQGFTLFSTIVIVIVLVAVLLQTLWLLPILDARADQWIAGVEVAKTNHHFYYVGFELTKLVALIYCFVKTYQYGGHPG